MIGLVSILLILPLVGALAVLCVPRSKEKAVQDIALGVMGLEFLASLALLRQPFDTAGFKFTENIPWIDSFGIAYSVGVDGISLWLIILTTLLSPIALYISFGSITERIKEYAVAFLLLQVGMLGAFVALDLFLFYIFWELMLIPMALIIGIWGGQDRVYAAVKFFLYTMVGSMLMLVGILYIVWTYSKLGGKTTFDLLQLRTIIFDTQTQYFLFAAFGLAFAIKIPMFPFHTWLPDAHVQAPTGGSVILAAVLLKLGAYGFLRFAMPMFPVASVDFAPFIAGLGIAGIIYGALAAWAQKDVKKLIAYSSVSHMGFVVLGMFALSQHGVSGAVLQMINHGVSTGALFILIGVIYDRAHTRMFDDFGGLAKVMPWYALAFVIMTMSSIGLPGTNGFIGEFMIISGTFFSNPRIGFGDQRFVLAALSATGVVLAAIYMLHAVLRLFWGPLRNPEHAKFQDLNKREVVALAPLLVLVFVIGLYPRFFLERIDPSVKGFIADYTRMYRLGAGTEETHLLGAQAQIKKKRGNRVRSKAGANAPQINPVVAPAPQADGACGAEVEGCE